MIFTTLVLRMRALLLGCFSLFCCAILMGQEIVAHRGASFDAPENTLSAFRLAWQQQADAVEGDFYLTADGEIVCIHDKDTERTAPGQEVRVVSESTLAELKRLDVGSWKGKQFEGERIPTIQEVLKEIPQGKKILIEIKCGSEIVPKLKQHLSESGLLDEQVLIICFQADVIRAVRESMPQYKTNWLTSYRKNKDTNNWEPNLETVLFQLGKCGATGLGTQGRREVVDREFFQQVTKAGFEAHVWTVNEPKDAEYYSSLEFDSITTDRPALIRQSL
jgi:glycerophosphoryl diester phosphodiesterase